jgi:hypothetical protein
MLWTIGLVSTSAVREAEADARGDGCADMVQSAGGSDMSQVSVSEGNVKSKVVCD